MGIPIGMLILVVAAVIIVGAIIVIAVVSARKESAVVTGNGSYFDGNTWQLIGYRILSALVNTITLGIAYPWMLCMVQRWETKHTIINGRRLKFNGKGVQLIGKWILWVFLTIITFGIYGIWLGLGMKKWVVKHTVYADDEKPVDSYFSGGAGGFLGIHLLSFVLTVFTLGIGKAWADKMVLCWEAKHTHIGGSPLEFNGKGGQLLVKYILFVLLTPLTLGIYALFFPVIYIKWQTKNTVAVYQKPEIQAEARAHEIVAVQDYAKYRIAANDTEIAMMKSGYTGKETTEELEVLAEQGNPYACYRLATQLKADAPVCEDRALELLQIAANAKYYPAQFDLAQQLPKEQAIPMLEDAARNGSSVAPWLLVNHYNQSGSLKEAAYWFKVALEWGDSNARLQQNEYDTLLKQIALSLCYSTKEKQEKKKTSPIVWCGVAVAGVLLLVGIIFGIMFTSAVNNPSRDFMGARIIRVYSDSMSPELKAGDVIYLDDDFSNVEIGDIIAFVQYDEYGYGISIVHRIVDVVTEEDGSVQYITAGDANSIQDTNPVRPENVIGVYTHKASFIGKILGSFQSSDSLTAIGNGPVEWEEPLEGDGSESSPYIIANVFDLQKYVSNGGDGDYGTITQNFDIYADYIYYGNNTDNLDVFVEQVNAGYLRFQNAEITITYEGDEVVCDNRINLSDTTQTDSTDNQSNNTQNNDVQNTETPTTTETEKVDISESVEGEWENYSVNGDVLVYTYWRFLGGKIAMAHKEYMVSVEGNLNYDGRCWQAVLGTVSEGTYTLDGNKMTISCVEQTGDQAESYTRTISVQPIDYTTIVIIDDWNGGSKTFNRTFYDEQDF